MCALFPIGKSIKNSSVTKGTIAIIGKSHIGNSRGTANLLIRSLKENIENIIKIISKFTIKLKKEITKKEQQTTNNNTQHNKQQKQQ